MNPETNTLSVYSLYELSQEMLSLGEQWSIDWSRVEFDDVEGNTKLTLTRKHDDESISCPICQGIGYLDKDCERICNLCEGTSVTTSIEYQMYLEMLNSEEI